MPWPTTRCSGETSLRARARFVTRACDIACLDLAVRAWRARAAGALAQPTTISSFVVWARLTGERTGRIIPVGVLLFPVSTVLVSH